MFLLLLIMLRLSQILLSSLPPTWPNICMSFQLHMTQWSPNHSPASTYFPETVSALLQSDKIVTPLLSCVIERKILRIGNEDSQFYLSHNLQIVPLTLLSSVTLMFHSVLFISVCVCICHSSAFLEFSLLLMYMRPYFKLLMKCFISFVLHIVM